MRWLFNILIEFESTSQRARARVEDEKAEESSNPDSNPDILRVQAEVEKTTSEAEAAGTTNSPYYS